ncbi:MAG: response regulator [Deltaproteobacteria bacterium]|nr:response regulator [Deltaproteobacteria bacterium]
MLSSPSASAGLPVVRTLLVEDNPGDAHLAAERLAGNLHATFDIACVPTLRDAKARLTSHPIDLILLDLHLPDSAGLPTLAAIRQHTPATATIVLSGSVDPAIRDRAVGLGAEEVIAKSELLSQLFGLAVLSVLERRRVRSHEELLLRLLERTPDAVVVVNRAGQVRYVNDAALAFFRKDRDALAAEPLAFIAPESGAIEIQVPSATGIAVGLMRVVDFDWRGEPASLAMIHDITKQRGLELQLLTSDRLVALGTLAAGVGHEINNPLASVVGNLDFALSDLAAGRATDEAAAALRDAQEGAERIRLIVRDLRVFARTEDETLQICDVNRLLDTVIRMAWNEVRHRAELVKDYDALAPVEACESRLCQVFLNLIVNAAQAIPPGGNHRNQIRVSTAMVDDGQIEVCVRDTGAGIAPDVQRRLFTPFFTTKPVGAGTGLGLAICHRIVTQLGGTIAVESTVGVGTSVTVTLPTVAERRTRAETVPPPMVPTAPRRGRVLVIDDEDAIGHAVRRMLAAEHEVHSVTSAAAAVAGFERGERFDVVLCDLMMPDMTGFELCATLERVDPSQAERLVIMTGGAFSPDAREFIEARRYHVLEKPFDSRKLRSVVNRFVQ